MKSSMLHWVWVFLLGYLVAYYWRGLGNATVGKLIGFQRELNDKSIVSHRGQSLTRIRYLRHRPWGATLLFQVLGVATDAACPKGNVSANGLSSTGTSTGGG